MKKPKKDVQNSFHLIQKLAAYRDEYLSIRRSAPRFERACQIMGTTPEVVNRHSPELVEKWYDSEYHWSTVAKKVSPTPSESELSSEREARHTNPANKERKPVL